MGRKNKDTYGFTLVAIGLLIGFFLGAGIVYWYSNRPKEPFITGNTFDHFSKLWQTADGFLEEVINGLKTTDQQTITYDSPQAQTSSNKDVESIAENQPTDNHSQPIPDSLAAPKVKPMSTDTLLITDGQKDRNTFSVAYVVEPSYNASASTVDAPPGTVNVTANTVDVSAGTINIRKEELIGIREFLLPSNGDNHYQSAETEILDSLLGRPQTSEQNRTSIFVEFWESPLNYTGFRMIKNRIVIYGIQQIDFVSFTEIDNKLFLKYNEDFFPIKATMDFKPLIPVNDPFLVNKSLQEWR